MNQYLFFLLLRWKKFLFIPISLGWALFFFWTLKHVFKLCCTFWIDLILGDFFSLSTQHLRIQRMSRRPTSESNFGNCTFIPLKKMYRLHHVQWSILPHPCISLHYFSWLSQPSRIFFKSSIGIQLKKVKVYYALRRVNRH